MKKKPKPKKKGGAKGWLLIREKPKKPRRVVLGIGHPWFYGGLTQLVLAEADRWDAKRIMLHISDLGAYNRIRLVAEVLK